MSDLIKRQDAIDVVKGIDRYFVKFIEELPSAQQWIPVGERLPEDGQRCLCTQVDLVYPYTYSKDLFKIDEYAFPKGRAGWYGMDNEWGYYEAMCITAWMPLPEPHKGDLK